MCQYEFIIDRYLDVLAKPLIGEFFRFHDEKGTELDTNRKEASPTRFFSYTDADVQTLTEIS